MFAQLEGIAERGLCEPHPNEAEASSALKGLQEEITDAATQVRSDYLRGMRIASIFVGFLGLILCLVAFVLDENFVWVTATLHSLNDQDAARLIDGLSAFGLALIGLVVGTLFFAYSQTEPYHSALSRT